MYQHYLEKDAVYIFKRRFLLLMWPGASVKQWFQGEFLLAALNLPRIYHWQHYPPSVNQVDGDQHYCWSKHFSGTFISFLFRLYCIIDGMIWKQYLSTAACAVPLKDRILALNPPVLTQDGGSAACFPFVLAYIGICLHALLHVKVWNWPQPLELSGIISPPREMKRPPTQQPALAFLLTIKLDVWLQPLTWRLHVTFWNAIVSGVIFCFCFLPGLWCFALR